MLRRTGDEESARSLVASLRREFHDARHHCSAFVLGPDREVQRSSDDGEPSGTAGLPMLEALVKRETAPGVTDLSDATAVVVRYFGGICWVPEVWSAPIPNPFPPRWRWRRSCAGNGCGSAMCGCRMPPRAGSKTTCARRAT